MTQSKSDGAAWTQRVPVVLLLSAVGLAAVGALGAHRAVVSNQQAAEQLIRDYSQFAAWTYQQKTAEIFDRTVEDDVDGVEGARWPDPLREHGNGSRSRRRDRSERWDPESDFLFRIPIDPPDAPQFAGVIPSNREAITRLVREHAGQTYQRRWRFALLYPADHGVDAPPLAYSVSSRRGDRARVANGLAVRSAVLAEHFARVVEREELLPPLLSEGRRNEDLLAIVVSNDTGQELFSTARRPDPRFSVEMPLPEHLGSLTVRVSVLPETADQLIIGGLPKSRMPLLISVFALAAIMTFVAAGQLRRAGELARLRSDFVASVSHELRTPLTQIRLYLDTLRLGRARTAEQRQWSIDNIDRETSRLINLVENVLEFSRSERIQTSGFEDPCDVAVHTEDVVAEFQSLVPAGDTQLSVAVPATAPVRINADSYRQILVNLLDNAIKYGPRDQAVSVAVETVGDRVRVSVTDQGPGIPVNERQRVWDSFYRGRAAVGTVAAGSGIGLAVVKEIVRRQEGHATLEEAPGGGTRVILDFPMAAVNLDEGRPIHAEDG